MTGPDTDALRMKHFPHLKMLDPPLAPAAVLAAASMLAPSLERQREVVPATVTSAAAVAPAVAWQAPCQQTTVFSDWADVDSGILQGSLLGPVLFIIYINDLIEYCDCGSELYLYADDAKVFKHIKMTLIHRFY